MWIEFVHSRSLNLETMRIYIHTLLEAELRDLVLDGLSEEYTVAFREVDDTDEAALVKCQLAQMILGNVPTQWALETQGLLFWQLDSAGFDKYKGTNLDARIANMGDWFARPCAETIVGGIMALYRGIDTLTLLKQKSEWVGHRLRPALRLLDRQRVVVLGSGTIGTATREILSGFRCQVKTLARTSPEAELHSREELLAELATTDLVINTLPGTADGYVDAEFLAAMKPGSVYANVGRGNTTREEALMKALNSGHLSGAVLDVTDEEPLPLENALWNMPNVILTQHTGGGQSQEDVGKVQLFLRNVENIQVNRPIENEVDLKRGY